MRAPRKLCGEWVWRGIFGPVGVYWPYLVMLAFPIVGLWWQRRHPSTRYEDRPPACPECDHWAGLDESRSRCGDINHYTGWISEDCFCQNDYHWRYESTAA